MAKIALRIRQDTGEIYVLQRGRSGNFEFGDPKYKNEKHHEKYVVEKSTLDDAIKAIEFGYYPRMRGIITGQFNMISPDNVHIVEVPE